ncbi:hypothetical protein GCM10018962_58950 [Dactylosporangium matsuzakiense]|uniref:Uncharacterized protein n=1 Tax=Dactylosporangium matsuzakiense TaxID=53360 RepID=A0A9W6NNH9_9ACTN|nr:hypothetical protein GCM10017581_052100 [Dactylosporangium matsuzakiense]
MGYRGGAHGSPWPRPLNRGHGLPASGKPIALPASGQILASVAGAGAARALAAATGEAAASGPQERGKRIPAR